MPVVTQLGALFFADWRAFINDVRRARRSPVRVAIWIGYALALGAFFWSRFWLSAGHASNPYLGQADRLRADSFMCALLGMLALALASGFGAVGIFRTRAEARFIIGSPILAPFAIAYLQAREVLAQGLRTLLSFIYFIFIFGPRRLGPLAVLADMLLVLAIVCASAAIVVPRRLLPRPAAIVCIAVGIPGILLAATPILREMVAARLVPLPAAIANAVLAFIPEWHPGVVLFEPQAGPVFAALVLAATAIVVLASGGRDAYPELYALSVARIDRLERLRQRRSEDSPRGTPRAASSTIPAPGGVLIFVWKSAVEFRRRRRRAFIVGGALLWCVAGFVAARAAAADREALFATLVGVVVNVMLFVGIGATGTIAGEVRRPLFWLSPAALFDRLCALALARIWRTVMTLEFVAAGFALGGAGLIDTLVFALGLPAFVALLAGVSFAAFAFFPDGADARGPVVLLRLGVSGGLLLPPLALAIGAALVLGSAVPGLVAATLLALIEAGGLLGIAAWRLDGHIDRLPA